MENSETATAGSPTRKQAGLRLISATLSISAAWHSAVIPPANTATVLLPHSILRLPPNPGLMSNGEPSTHTVAKPSSNGPPSPSPLLMQSASASTYATATVVNPVLRRSVFSDQLKSSQPNRSDRSPLTPATAGPPTTRPSCAWQSLAKSMRGSKPMAMLTSNTVCAAPPILKSVFRPRRSRSSAAARNGHGTQA